MVRPSSLTTTGTSTAAGLKLSGTPSSSGTSTALASAKAARRAAGVKAGAASGSDFRSLIVSVTLPQDQLLTVAGHLHAIEKAHSKQDDGQIGAVYGAIHVTQGHVPHPHTVELDPPDRDRAVGREGWHRDPFAIVDTGARRVGSTHGHHEIGRASCRERV